MFLFQSFVSTIWQLCIVLLPLSTGLTLMIVVISSALTKTVDDSDTGEKYLLGFSFEYKGVACFKIELTIFSNLSLKSKHPLYFKDLIKSNLLFLLNTLKQKSGVKILVCDSESRMKYISARCLHICRCHVGDDHGDQQRHPHNLPDDRRLHAGYLWLPCLRLSGLRHKRSCDLVSV